jgi:hypothetical protein
MAFRYLGTEVKHPLTPSDIAAFAALPGGPCERAESEDRIKYLVGAVTAGKAIPFQWATAKLDDTVFRVNGQHSPLALAKMNGNLPDNLVAHITEFEVDTKEDLADLFRQFDSRRSARTPADVSGAYQGLEDDLGQAPRAAAKLAVEGVAWYLRNILGTVKLKGDDTYTLFSKGEYHDFINWYGDLLSRKTPELKKKPVVAAMYNTYDVAPDDAMVFWRDAAQAASNGDDTKPAVVLDHWLLAQSDGQQAGKPATDAQVFQACAYAWAADRKGKTIDRVKTDLKKGFIVIE